MALITGAGQGIGFAVACAFVKKNYSVIVSGRTIEKLNKVKKELSRDGGKVVSLTADVTDPEQIGSLARQVETDFGKLDVLVNCVGNFAFAPVLQHSREQWYDVLNSNLTSVFLLCRAMTSLLKKSENGRIINIGASYASIQRGFPNYGPFAAAKAAVVSLTKTLAIELAPFGITVNVVSPGLIDTGSYSREAVKRWSREVPAGRFGRPDEVARAVAFLASKDSSYITGTELVVGGGWEGQAPDS